MNSEQAASTATTVGTAAGLSESDLTAFAEGDVLGITDLDARQASITALYRPDDGSLVVQKDGTAVATLSRASGLSGRFTVTTDRSGGTLIPVWRGRAGAGPDHLVRRGDARCRKGVRAPGHVRAGLG